MGMDVDWQVCSRRLMNLFLGFLLGKGDALQTAFNPQRLFVSTNDVVERFDLGLFRPSDMFKACLSLWYWELFLTYFEIHQILPGPKTKLKSHLECDIKSAKFIKNIIS